MGLRFPNRVGLAAGFDKNGVAVDGLGTLGFGFLCAELVRTGATICHFCGTKFED